MIIGIMGPSITARLGILVLPKSLGYQTSLIAQCQGRKIHNYPTTSGNDPAQTLNLDAKDDPSYQPKF